MPGKPNPKPDDGNLGHLGRAMVGQTTTRHLGHLCNLGVQVVQHYQGYRHLAPHQDDQDYQVDQDVLVDQEDQEGQDDQA